VRNISYGRIDQELHYYVPPKKLIDKALQELKGDNPNKCGHFITNWTARQTGKSWIMQKVLFTLEQEQQFDVVMLPLQHLYNVTDVNRVAQIVGREVNYKLGLKKRSLNTLEDFEVLFKRKTLRKPFQP
jgi:hypothetical protein